MHIYDCGDCIVFPDKGGNKGEDNEDTSGEPKPMLPYSSMFIFHPTNP